jgi:hypothetical protein
VFPGNSGGPVFVNAPPAQAAAPGADPGFIAGLLTQQVEINSENLSIGIVTDARFVRETLSLLDNPNAVPATAHVTQQGAPTPGLMSAADAAYSR